MFAPILSAQSAMASSPLCLVPRRPTPQFSGRRQAPKAAVAAPLELVVRQLARVHTHEHTLGKHRVRHLLGGFPRTICLGGADAGYKPPATARFVPLRHRHFSATEVVRKLSLSWLAMVAGSAVPQSFIISVSRVSALCVDDLLSIGQARSTTPSSGCVRYASAFCRNEHRWDVKAPR